MIANPTPLVLAAGGLLIGPIVTAAVEPAGTVEVRIERLRNARGIVRLCLTSKPESFPNCRSDPAALKLSVPASDAASTRFTHVEPGTYALAVLHDENGNGKLDTFMKMPREGFGFSHNPAIRLGPPRFEEARFTTTSGITRQVVRVRYLL